MNILLFAGTTEGRQLVNRLRPLPVEATICVATGYGAEMLEGVPGRFAVRIGRLDAERMRSLARREGFGLVVDATHPYAVEASRNIREAAEKSGLPYLRLLREKSRCSQGLHVADAEEAAARLAELEGRVLLTTGAKDLAAYTKVPDFAERMFPRVLPTVESIRRCEELGFRRGHVIAMQGPFGRELNLALMRQFGIGILVTKDGGAAGGFLEKIGAAEDAGVLAVVLGRPPERDGMSGDAVFAAIAGMLGGASKNELF